MCNMHCRDFGHTLCYSFRISTSLIVLLFHTMKQDQERVRVLLVDTNSLLCKNGLAFKKDLKVHGLLGITVDDKEVFIVHINEKFADGAQAQNAETANAITDVDAYGARLAKRLKALQIEDAPAATKKKTVHRRGSPWSITKTSCQEVFRLLRDFVTPARWTWCTSTKSKA